MADETMMQKLTDAMAQSKWTECFGEMDWQVTYENGRKYQSENYRHIDDSKAVMPQLQMKAKKNAKD